MPNNNPSKLAHLKMPDYSGSWFKIRYNESTSYRIGKYTPHKPIDIVGNSLVKLSPELRIESLPAVSPLYGGYTIRTKFYFAPYRLYIPELRKNRQLPWNSIPSLSLPRMTFTTKLWTPAHAESVGFHASFAGSLLERLNMMWGDTYTGQMFGMKELQQTSSDFIMDQLSKFSTNMLPLLAYIDSWMYGEYNPQDKNIPIDVDTIYFGSVGGGDSFRRQYRRAFLNYDDLRSRMDEIIYGNVRTLSSPEAKFVVEDGISGSRSLNFTWLRDEFVSNYPLFSRVEFLASTSNVAPTLSQIKTLYNSGSNMCSAVGLLPVTYKGDRYTSWYSEEGINILKDYKITNGETFLSLRKRNDDFMVSALSLISGNRFVDYLQYIFDSELELKDHPILVGYDEFDIGMIEVLSNANTGDSGNDVLGARGSFARQYSQEVKPISFKTKEPGMLLVCTSIVPTVSYYQGFDRFQFARHFEDLWQPPYSSQGFQQIFRGEVFSPFMMSDVEVMDDNTYRRPSGVSLKELNKIGLGWVPLGWQYMASFNTLSGAFRTSAYKTWSNRRDVVSFDMDNKTTSPIFNAFADPAVDELKSTYVDSFLFNDNFVNISNAESENFTARLKFDISIYQPISKTLITKTF